MNEPELNEADAMALLDRATKLAQLMRALKRIPNCLAIPLKKGVRYDLQIQTTYAHEDALRSVLKRFGICPRKRCPVPPVGLVGGYYRRHRLLMQLRLPRDW